MELTFITRETPHSPFLVPRIFLSSQVEIIITLFVLRFLLLYTNHSTFFWATHRDILLALHPIRVLPQSRPPY
jgi:hypothetical protein